MGQEESLSTSLGTDGVFLLVDRPGRPSTVTKYVNGDGESREE